MVHMLYISATVQRVTSHPIIFTKMPRSSVKIIQRNYHNISKTMIIVILKITVIGQLTQ